MSIVRFYLFFGALCVFEIRFLEASYGCGIRRHSFIQLVHHGYNVEEGQWPWHVALFHKKDNVSSKYACGGTLIDEKHILTAAHCVVNCDTGYPLPESSIELRFGLQNLSKISNHTLIRDVSKVHVHPEFSTHRNDIAVLVTRLPVEYTNFVIPICMDEKVDRNLRNLEGKRGWITGWGTTQSGALLDVLRTASMPVVDHLKCIKDDIVLFGNVLDETVFCAGDRNAMSSAKSYNATIAGTVDIYTRVSSHLDWIEETVWNGKPLMTTTSTSAPPPRAPSSNRAIVFPDWSTQ